MDIEKAQRGGAIRVFVADNSPIHTQLLADALKRDVGLEGAFFISSCCSCKLV